MAKSSPYLVPIFQEKYDYFLLHFGLFLVKKGRGQQLKDPNENLTYPIVVSQFWGIFLSKKFCPSTCQFCGYRCQRLCFFNFEPLFQVWLLFQVPHPITWQKYLSLSNVEFISASIDTNFNQIGQTTVEIGYCFLLAPSPFSANSIKFTFSVFPDHSGPVGKFFPHPEGGEKLGGTFLKKIKSIAQQEHVLKQKQKNVISL